MQEIVEAVEGTPEEVVINTVLLRSMQQAKYDPESLGHFGLSTDYYTHFTSPIRRYPDLIVHRLIRTYLIEGKTDSATIEHWNTIMSDIADHTSKRERRAVDAERETDDLKKAEYMLDKIGEEFDGMISSVTNFGMFVELPNTIEGLVHVSAMNDDYYRFDERHLAMIGERSAKVFRIGDEIKVKVISVNKEERAIDFEVAGMINNRRKREDSERKVFKARSKDRKRTGSSSSSGETRSSSRRRKSNDTSTASDKAGKSGRKKNKKFFENVPKNKRNKKKKRR